MARMPSFALGQLKGGAPPKLLTLVIVNQANKALLGMKKRGFGTGFYNGFGGKVETGETIAEAAVRELEEEAGITPVDMTHKAVLNFLFDDQPRSWEVHVFEVKEFTGEPTESEEMAPTWFSHEELPFDKMWADDVHWYPLFLRGAAFHGAFAFQHTTQLVWQQLQEVAELDNPAFLRAVVKHAEQPASCA